MVGLMKSMDAMKPLTRFMMVLKTYTKECLHRAPAHTHGQAFGTSKAVGICLI